MISTGRGCISGNAQGVLMILQWVTFVAESGVLALPEYKYQYKIPLKLEYAGD